MRKTFLYMALFAVVLAAGAGCTRPKEIPRGELGEIFKEAFLINAYYQLNPMVMQAMQMDSLDIYRPILKRHGYTLRDLEYTVQGISKQKSRNLSDIVERSIAELKKESEMLDERVAALDTVNARAGRMFMRRVLFEEQITAEKVSDTSKLRITLPVNEGTYTVSYKYLVDSLDENWSVRIMASIIDTAGRRRPAFSQMLVKMTRQSPAPQRFETTAADSALVLVLGNYPAREMKRPHLTVDSLEVVYFLPQQQALDSLMKTLFHLYLPPYYGAENPAAQDSGALRPDTLGADPVGAGDAL